MTATLKCISPIDGSVYAERPVLSRDDAFAAVARARKAQKDWQEVPMEERIRLVRSGVARVVPADAGPLRSACRLRLGTGPSRRWVVKAATPTLLPRPKRPSPAPTATCRTKSSTW